MDVATRIVRGKYPWIHQRVRWQARVRGFGESIFLGVFETEAEAVAVENKFRKDNAEDLAHYRKTKGQYW